MSVGGSNAGGGESSLDCEEDESFGEHDYLYKLFLCVRLTGRLFVASLITVRLERFIEMIGLWAACGSRCLFRRSVVENECLAV